jgi:hypothetical protein
MIIIYDRNSFIIQATDLTGVEHVGVTPHSEILRSDRKLAAIQQRSCPTAAYFLCQKTLEEFCLRRKTKIKKSWAFDIKSIRLW